MSRLRKSIPFIALGVLVVVVPVLANTVFAGQNGDPTATASDVNMGLLLLVNRMDLSQDQMQTLHQLLSELLDQQETWRAALAEKQDAFEQQMIAFQGTPEELDVLIEAQRTAVADLVRTSREEYAALFDELGDLLTYNQGMLLEKVLPRLDGSLLDDRLLLGWAARAAAQGTPSAGRQPAGGQGSPPGGSTGFGQPAWGATTPSDDQTAAGRTSNDAANPCSGQMNAQAPAGSSALGPFQRGMAFAGGPQAAGRGDGLQILEQLIRLLELKLQA